MPEDQNEPSAEELEELMKALEEDADEQEQDTQPQPTEKQEDSDTHKEEPSEHDAHEHVVTSAYMEEPEMNIGTFFDSWSLFGDAALSGALAGGLLGALGIYIILKRMVFLSAALSQSASFGIVLMFFLQMSLGLHSLHPMIGAGVMTFVALLILSSKHIEQPGVRDSALGLVYVAGAAGTLILGTRIVQELHDVQTILFGSAVAVVPEDFHLLVVVTLVLGAIHVVGWRGFTAIVLDAEDSSVRGLPVKQLELLLMITLAAAVALSTAILGALPTFAFSILPGMIALKLVANVQRALVLAALIGASTGFIGYVLAFIYELPVGASQAMVGVAWVLTGLVIALLKRRIA